MQKSSVQVCKSSTVSIRCFKLYLLTLYIMINFKALKIKHRQTWWKQGQSWRKVSETFHVLVQHLCSWLLMTFVLTIALLLNIWMNESINYSLEHGNCFGVYFLFIFFFTWVYLRQTYPARSKTISKTINRLQKWMNCWIKLLFYFSFLFLVHKSILAVKINVELLKSHKLIQWCCHYLFGPP